MSGGGSGKEVAARVPHVVAIRFLTRLVLALCLGASPPVHADTATGTTQSSQLYTPPDATAGGGLRGTISRTVAVVRGVFALPVDDWKQVYRAKLDADGRSFLLAGLPVGRYDLVVLGDDAVWEGLSLYRGEDALPSEDREALADAVKQSNPFFDTKRVERAEGVGGENGRARAFLQEVRTRPVTLQSAEVRSDIQVRSLKLLLAERVGKPGWAIVHTREIVRQEVPSGDPKGLLQHRCVKTLGGLRVIDAVKDVGVLTLP